MADDGSILVSSLPPDQQKQLLAPPADLSPGVDVVDATNNPEDLEKLISDDEGGFSPTRWLNEHTDAPKDKQNLVADAWALHHTGFRVSDINLKKSGSALLKLPGQLVKATLAASQEVFNPLYDLVTPKLAPNAQAELQKQRDAKSAEFVASKEEALTGLADMALKAGKWAGRQVGKLAVDPSKNESWMKNPLDQTPQERLDALWNDAGIAKYKENVAKGHGPLTQAVLGGVIADLEKAGGKVDDRAVHELAAGDIFSFVAFGKGFQIGTGALKGGVRAGWRGVATVASKAEAVQAVAALNAAQRAAAKTGAAASRATDAAMTAEGAFVKASEVAAAAAKAVNPALDAEAMAARTAPVEGEFVQGLTNLDPNLPTLSSASSAALDEAVAAASAARAASLLGESTAEAATAAQKAAAAARAELGTASEAVANSPAAKVVQHLQNKAGAISDALVTAKSKIGTAAAATVERGADIVASLAPRAVGYAANTAWLAGEVISGVLPPIATPHLVRTIAEKAEGVGASQLGIAKQLVKGDVRAYGPGTGALSSTAQAVPTVLGNAAKGAIFDVGLASVVSETPEDTANMAVFGTAIMAGVGALKALQSGTARQLIDPSNRYTLSESRRASKPYGQLRGMDEVTKFSVDQAKDPNEVKRLSALRDFLEGTGTEIHWAADKNLFLDLLKKYVPGHEPQWYADAAEQPGVNLSGVYERDAAGNIVPGSRKINVSLVQNLDAAPHEANHNWQSVFSEKAMQGIDRLTHDEYADTWEQRGQNYVQQFFGAETIAKKYAARGEGWREAWLDLASGKTTWRESLTPEQITGISDSLLAREISGEVGDALFKHGGKDMLQNKSLPGKIARIMAKIMTGMGIEPFQGVVSEGQNQPLTFSGTEKSRAAIQGAITDYKATKARPDILNGPGYEGKKPKVTVSPRGEKPPPSETGGAPVTPAAPKPPPTPKDAADEARGFASEVPDEPTVRGGRSRKAVLEDIADAIEKRTGLTVDYMSAPGEPAGAVTSQRVARRAIIEAFRTMPKEARALFEKQFVPEQVVTVGGGKLQVMGWAPEVFAANAHKLAKALTDAKSTRLSPYEIDKKTGSFSERGWRELFIDATNFSRNQQAGLTGAGEPLVVPSGVVEKGFFAPTAEGEAGHPLDQRKADVLSALFGIPIPKTPRIGKVYPRNLAGQEVSAATKPGRVSAPVVPREPFTGPKAEQMGIEGRTINEVNPFRADLEAKGIRPDFIEALQRLNLENIADVSAKPAGTTEIRGKEFTLQAGFQPKKDEPRAIKSAAIRLPSGKIFTGRMHWQAFERAKKAGQVTNTSDFEDGYVTNGGEFLDRNAAGRRALTLGQMTKDELQFSSEHLGGATEDLTNESLEAKVFTQLRQFQPKPDEPRAVKGAAIRLSQSGKIFEGYFHADAYEKAFEAGAIKDGPNEHVDEGYVTNSGEFLDRLAAEARALELKQLTKKDVKENRAETLMADEEPYGLEAATFSVRRRFQPKLEDVSKEKRGKGTEVTVRRPDGSTYQAMDAGPAEGFENGEIVTRRAIGIPVAGKDGVVKMNHGLMPKDHTIVTGDEGGPQADWRVVVQSPQGEVPGFVQLEDPKQQDRATTVEDLRKAGHDVPDFSRLPQGRYTYAEATARLNNHAAFQSKKGFIGTLEDGEIKASWADLSSTTHGDHGLRSGLAWRYNPETETVYWWEKPEDKRQQDLVDFWLEKKGHSVGGGHVNIESTERRYNDAHGSDYASRENPRFQGNVAEKGSKGYVAPPDRPFAEQKATVVPQALIDETKARFAPKKGKEDPLKFIPTSHASPSKAWILPDGSAVQLGAQWHHHWLDENPDVQKKYGLKVPAFEGNDAEGVREAALKKGFARVNYEPASGRMTVEARQKDWRKVKGTVQDMAATNLDDIEKMSIHVLDEKADKPVDSASDDYLFRLSDKDKESAIADMIDSIKFSPKRGEQEMLPGISAKRAPLSTVERASMTRQEVRDHYPEAVVPRANDESIPSEITKSPLYKQAGNEDAAVGAFADRLVSFAKEYQDDPMFDAGARWYSDFVPRLKKEFGDDAPIMAELLSATSPQTGVETNFGYAHDAMESIRAGRFDKITAKLGEGLKKIDDGSWEKTAKTPAAFLAEWINKYDLKPKQSNGKLYGQHSLAVLKVLTRRWVDENSGPKTANFVRNLTGDSNEATIDLWADRTMRWAGYEGHAPRWRILAENKHAVSDEDFAFSQKAFRAAAEKLGMEPSELQGALWFAEKQRWADNGWG